MNEEEVLFNFFQSFINDLTISNFIYDGFVRQIWYSIKFGLVARIFINSSKAEYYFYNKSFNESEMLKIIKLKSFI